MTVKKWFALLLLALVLAGCSDQSDTTAPETTVAQPTVAGGLYAPGSALENYTAGAVKLYPLERGLYDGIMPIGRDLLLLENKNGTKVIMMGFTAEWAHVICDGKMGFMRTEFLK